MTRSRRRWRDRRPWWRIWRRRRRHVGVEPGVLKPGQKVEQDVPIDPAVARTRASGGVCDPTAPDRYSTTGTTPTSTFVGRVAGDDIGYQGETGAETRAEANRKHTEDPESEPPD